MRTLIAPDSPAKAFEAIALSGASSHFVDLAVRPSVARSLSRRPFRFRLNTALCFSSSAVNRAEYEILLLGIKKRTTLNDLELRVAVVQVPNRRTARIPFVGCRVKPSILQQSLRLGVCAHVGRDGRYFIEGRPSANGKR